MEEPRFSLDVDFRNESVRARSSGRWTYAGLFDPGPAGSTRYFLDLPSTRLWYPDDAEHARAEHASVMPRRFRLAAIESMVRELARPGVCLVVVIDEPGATDGPDPDADEILALIERLRPELGGKLEVQRNGVAPASQEGKRRDAPLPTAQAKRHEAPPSAKSEDPLGPVWLFLVTLAVLVVIGVGWSLDSRVHHAVLLQMVGRETRAQLIDLDSEKNPLSQSLAAAFYSMLRPRIFTLTFVFTDRDGGEHRIDHEVGDASIDWMHHAGPEEDRLAIVYLPFDPEVAMPVDDIHFEPLEAFMGLASLALALLGTWWVVRRRRRVDPG